MYNYSIIRLMEMPPENEMFQKRRTNALAMYFSSMLLAVWCSSNALVSINAVALHRARLVLGWVTAFGQVNCLIT